MNLDAACNLIVEEFRSRPTLRAGSLITTVFGDSIAPRGGTVWLGSLIRAMADFGINERLVRTSVFRLVQDGWLQSSQVGRRSFYSLTEEGRDRFRAATHRIYESDLDMALKRVGVANEVVVMSAHSAGSDASLRVLVRSAWNLDGIDARYEQFVSMFRPVYAALTKTRQVDPRTAFVIRTLLVQEYRKVLLRDPQLPQQLLPAGWHGTPAYQLCRNLYKGLYQAADDYLSEFMETADGPLPPPVGDYLQRFGGLADTSADARKSA